MKDFIFHEGVVPSRYSFSFTESLFNQLAHRQLQSKSNWHSFFILNQTDNSIDGLIHFHLWDGIAESPLRASHGGFDLDCNIEIEVLLGFVNFVELRLQKMGAKRIHIKLGLRLKNSIEFNLVEDSLIKSGFQILRIEEGGILRVTESYAKHIHYTKRKRLNRAVRNNFEFMKVEKTELNAVYSFIQSCRKRKKYEISMSLEEMNDLVCAFPDKVKLFVVKDGDQFIAASICLRINTEVLYDFYHDHDSAYDEVSPIVFLVNGIHDYCLTERIPLIDLGTAMNGDKVNIGLLEFKLKLGADRAIKYEFEKHYS